MTKIAVDDAELKKLIRSFGLVKEDLKRLNEKLNSKLPSKIIRMLEKKTPTDTGETRAAWDVSRKGSNGFIITNDNGSIIQFLMDGTKPHKIEPVDKSVLLFSMGSSKIFAKFVNHPGYSSKMDERSIYMELGRIIDKVVDEVITSILRKKLR